MTLEELGNLGDFIGGIAVIITLAYLAVQIRQNTKLLQKSTEQMFRSDSTAVISLAAQHPENAAVFNKGLTEPDSLLPDERAHFFLIMTANFYHLQTGHMAHNQGSVSEDVWNSQWQALQLYASRPGMRVWWKRQGNRLIPPKSEFWCLVDSEVQKHEGSAA